MFSKTFINTLVLVLACILASCSIVKKPKEWFEKEEDPREPTKLTKIQTESVRVQSVWRNSIGDLEETFGKIRPYINDSSVFLTDAKGRVEAWQRDNGRRIWSISLKVEISGGVNGGDGIVAVGTENGVVIALDEKNGEERWRTTLTSEVIAISETGFGVILVRTNDSFVYALEIGSGEIAWDINRPPPALTLRGASVPVIRGDAALIGFDDGRLMSVSLRDGNIIWEIPVSIPKGRTELERMTDVDGEIVYFEGVVYASSFNGNVVAVDMDTGKANWTNDISSHVGLSVDYSHVYVTDDDGYVYALDLNSGGTLWRQDKLLYREVTAPQVMGDYVVVGDYKGHLHWLSKENGAIVGRNDVGGDAVLVPPRIINERAYVLLNNGSLSVLQYRKNK